jgi:pyruvate kinase
MDACSTNSRNTLRKAKIVATLGPSSSSPEMIRKLIRAGMNVARLNFSHGTHENHAALIANIRKVSKEVNVPIAILQDLQGPKLRVGLLPENGMRLSSGNRVLLAPSDDFERLQAEYPSILLIPMEIPELAESVDPGNRILLDDGHLEFQVIAVRDGAVEAEVVLGGVLSSHKGVNLPGARITIPGFTAKDREDLEFGLQQGIDLVAISFVRTPDDIETVRSAIKQISPTQADTPIIAKLERPEAIVNLEAIIAIADGVMVARGDLGVETSPSEVPITQKRIIAEANRQSKIVITATQMLDSMIHNPRPTRAEASDVANAIFDGTDAVMLSGETASGNFPLESVEMMDSIVREAEAHFEEWGHQTTAPEEISNDDAVSMTRAARELAHDRNVACIAIFTQSGRTAQLMAKARPCVPIMAFTPEARVYQRMALYWGVHPHQVPYARSLETMLTHVDTALIDNRIEAGLQVVIISGFPVGAWRAPNFALLHTIGSESK